MTRSNAILKARITLSSASKKSRIQGEEDAAETLYVAAHAVRELLAQYVEGPELLDSDDDVEAGAGTHQVRGEWSDEV